MSAQCDSCGAEIVWVKTTKGADMPLDSPAVGFAPSNDVRGLFAIAMGYSLGERVAVSMSKIDKPARGRLLAWRSHFATCPNADSHRR